MIRIFRANGPGDMYKGIALILAATLGIVLMNTCARMSSISHGPVEMIFYRGIIALSLLIPYMLLTHSPSVFKTKRFKAHLYRSLIGNVGVGFVFWAYSLLPMADATVLLFAAPLFVTALSPVLLKERIDRYRWIAVFIGFGGVLLIVDPSVQTLSHPASAVGLAAALCMALVDMALRNLGRTDDPLTTVFYFILIGVLVSGPYTVLFGAWPEAGLIPWIMGIGVFTAIQQVAKTTAFRFAEASLLAPYTYSAIIWATLIGWILWDELPTFAVTSGAVVVISSNLLIVWREKRKRIESQPPENRAL